ncbi:MAG: AAA family ATPase [Candidatus Omnitrophica bacterium]|nr:AAA family ATPase [Candidatus Omnitrophota bacterium]
MLELVCMTEKIDPEKMQKEFMEALKRLAAEERPSRMPETDKGQDESEEKRRQKRETVLRFDLKPKDVKKYLDRYVIRQEEAKRVLSIAVCDHYNHIRMCARDKNCKNYTKQNVVMLGPTGVGKTYLIRCLADLIGVPFVKADATKFSETGYVGGDVEDLVRDLVYKADGDIALAQYGMIYLDEIDKIAAGLNMQNRDVSGTGVQRGLLKIMEETEVSLRNPQDIQSQFQAILEFQQKGTLTKPVINTRHILFIVSGVFDQLPALIERRLKSSHVGFSAVPLRETDTADLLRKVQTEDFVKYGLEPEFIGRLPVRTVCDPLSEEDLYLILKGSEESILKQYTASFESYGIKIHYEDQSLWEMAKLASAEKTGARGLLTICERIFRGLKYELPSSSVKEFTLTAQMVTDPQKALEVLVEQDRQQQRVEIIDAIRRFEENFFTKSGIRIEFDQAGLGAVVSKVLDEGHFVNEFLERLLSNYVYGLGLIQKKSPHEKFILTDEVVKGPNTVLDQWIKETYEA